MQQRLLLGGLLLLVLGLLAGVGWFLFSPPAETDTNDDGDDNPPVVTADDDAEDPADGDDYEEPVRDEPNRDRPAPPTDASTPDETADTTGREAGPLTVILTGSDGRSLPEVHVMWVPASASEIDGLREVIGDLQRGRLSNSFETDDAGTAEVDWSEIPRWSLQPEGSDPVGNGTQLMSYNEAADEQYEVTMTWETPPTLGDAGYVIVIGGTLHDVAMRAHPFGMGGEMRFDDMEATPRVILTVVDPSGEPVVGAELHMAWNDESGPTTEANRLSYLRRVGRSYFGREQPNRTNAAGEGWFRPDQWAESAEDFALAVIHPDWQPEAVPYTWFLEEMPSPIAINLTKQSDSEYRLQLREGQTITGRVEDVNGRPVRHAWAFAVPFQDDDESRYANRGLTRTVRVDADGRFEIKGLIPTDGPTSEYFVYAEAEGYSEDREANRVRAGADVVLRIGAEPAVSFTCYGPDGETQIRPDRISIEYASAENQGLPDRYYAAYREGYPVNEAGQPIGRDGTPDPSLMALGAPTMAWPSLSSFTPNHNAGFGTSRVPRYTGASEEEMLATREALAGFTAWRTRAFNLRRDALMVFRLSTPGLAEVITPPIRVSAGTIVEHTVRFGETSGYTLRVIDEEGTPIDGAFPQLSRYPIINDQYVDQWIAANGAYPRDRETRAFEAAEGDDATFTLESVDTDAYPFLQVAAPGFPPLEYRLADLSPDEPEGSVYTLTMAPGWVLHGTVSMPDGLELINPYLTVSVDEDPFEDRRFETDEEYDQYRVWMNRRSQIERLDARSRTIEWNLRRPEFRVSGLRPTDLRVGVSAQMATHTFVEVPALTPEVNVSLGQTAGFRVRFSPPDLSPATTGAPLRVRLFVPRRPGEDWGDNLYVGTVPNDAQGEDTSNSEYRFEDGAVEAYDGGEEEADEPEATPETDEDGWYPQEGRRDSSRNWVGEWDQEAGTLTVRGVEPTEGAVLLTSGDTSAESRTLCPLEAGQITDLLVELQGRRSLRVRVEDPDGNPIEGARVVASDQAGENPLTPASGELLLEGLGSTFVEVRASAEGYGRAAHYVSLDVVSELTIRLQPLGRIHGTVYYRGAPLDNTYVQVVSPRGSRSDRTNAEGQFDITEISLSGTITLSVEIREDNFQRAETVTVNLPPGGDEEVEIRIGDDFVRVYGQFQNMPENGRGIVFVHGEGGDAIMVRPEEDLRYELWLAPGTYFVGVMQSYGGAATSIRVPSGVTEVERNPAFPTSSVSGTVRTPAGEPVGGMMAQLVPIEIDGAPPIITLGLQITPFYMAQVEGNGTFTFPQVQPGRYTLRIGQPLFYEQEGTYGFAEQEVRVTNGSNTQAEVTLGEGGSLQVMFGSISEEELSRSTITLTTPDGTPIPATRMPTQIINGGSNPGRLISAIPPGEYRLVVHLPRRGHYSDTVTIRAGETTEATVVHGAGGTLDITVTLPDGTPPAAMMYRIFDGSGRDVTPYGGISDLRSGGYGIDSPGHAVIDTLAPGTYRIEFQTLDGQHHGSTVASVVANQTVSLRIQMTSR